MLEISNDTPPNYNEYMSNKHMQLNRQTKMYNMIGYLPSHGQSVSLMVYYKIVCVFHTFKTDEYRNHPVQFIKHKRVMSIVIRLDYHEI